MVPGRPRPRRWGAFLAVMVLTTMAVAPQCDRSAQAGTLPTTEAELVSQVNGTRAYDLDRDLENITRPYPAYRSSGSAGANASADWIIAQMQTMGLSTHAESYTFPSWDLRARPSLQVAKDGDLDNDGGLRTLPSFNSEQWSSATLTNGSSGILAVLPLPAAANREEVGLGSIDQVAWGAIDTSNKIVIIGREVRWAGLWEQALIDKISVQRPAAIIEPYSYSWMADIDVAQMGSAAGRPLSGHGAYLSDLGIPVGLLNYSEGQTLMMMADGTACAAVRINSFQFNGEHLNIVGIIPGSVSGRQVLITSHYDSVMTNGFCDNGAGVAGMLEMARVLSSAYQEGRYAPRQDIVFIAFDGEELGLIGSLQYVSAHQTEVGMMDAIINLDCIGNRQFMLTPTEDVAENDIRLALRQAAFDLDVNMGDEAPGGSDQESFLHPTQVQGSILQHWNVPIPVNTNASNGNAVMLLSLPIVVTDLWTMNESGWIHTSKDAHTSHGWVSEAYLQDQLSVATLAVLRMTSLSTPSQAGDAWPLTLLTISLIVVILTLVVVWQRHRNK